MDTYRSDGPMIRRQPDDMPVVDFDETDNYHTCLQVGLAQLGAEILNLLAEIRDRLPPPAAVDRAARLAAIRGAAEAR